MTDSDVESDEEIQAPVSNYEDELLNRRRDGGVQLGGCSYKGRLILDLTTTELLQDVLTVWKVFYFSCVSMKQTLSAKLW